MSELGRVRPPLGRLVKANFAYDMVGVAQLVERRVVVADAAGSSPVTHPTERDRLTAPNTYATWRLHAAPCVRSDRSPRYRK